MYSSDHTGKETKKKRKKRNKQIKEIQYIVYMGLQWRSVAKKITIGAIAIMKPMNIPNIFKMWTGKISFENTLPGLHQVLYGDVQKLSFYWNWNLSLQRVNEWIAIHGTRELSNTKFLVRKLSWSAATCTICKPKNKMHPYDTILIFYSIRKIINIIERERSTSYATWTNN